MSTHPRPTDHPKDDTVEKLRRRVHELEGACRRHDAERRLHRRENRLLKTVFKTSPDGIALSRLEDGTCVDVNDAFLAMTGRRREEVIGRTSVELAFWKDKAERQTMIDELLERGHAADREVTIRRRDGAEHAGTLAARIVRLDDVDHVLAVVRDVEPWKRTQRRLRESMSRLTSILDSTQDIVFVLDDEGRYVEVLTRHDELLFRDAPNLIGSRMHDLLPVEVADPALATIHSALKTGRTQTLEYPLTVPAGERWFEGRTSPLEDRPGERSTVVWVVRDITERKKHQRERNELQQQLLQAQKMESIGRLAGGVAHDLNNTLSPIIGYADLVMRSATDPTLNRRMRSIFEAADRARNLTAQLLAFSRKQYLDMQVVNLSAEIGKLEKMLRRIVRENIRLVFKLDPALGNVRADTSQLHQVMLNLVVNAQDAMPDGGELIVETAEVTFDRHYARTHTDVRPGHYVRIVVSDTGCGMDAATRERIFEPFFTTKPQDKGTGLGLATSYGIVRQHHGTIRAYSEPGLGSTFKIYLPRVDAPAAVAETETAVTPRGAETVLVVEDDPIVRDMTSDILADHGYGVLVASGGEEALRLAESSDPPIDLLLTDVVMPGMNGLELARILRQKRPDLKAIFMSGYSEEVVIRQGLADPATPFIQKPASVETLTRRVRDVLDAG